VIHFTVKQVLKFFSILCKQNFLKLEKKLCLTLTKEITCERSEVCRILMSKIYCKSVYFLWKGKCLIQSTQCIGMHFIYPYFKFVQQNKNPYKSGKIILIFTSGPTKFREIKVKIERNPFSIIFHQTAVYFQVGSQFPITYPIRRFITK